MILEPLRDSLRRHLHRHAAVARPAHAQRARRRRRRADSAHVRVLRARGARRSRRHACAASAARSIPSLDIAGVLLTMYDERTNLGQQVAQGHPRLLPGSRLRDRDPAQHPARRSAEPRHPRDPLRRQVARRRRPTSRSRASSWSASPDRRPRTRSPTMVDKRPALGRGLSALIPERPPRRQRAPRSRSKSTPIC